MSQLTVIANIVAKPGKIELVKAELEKLIPITRSEAGCINYDLHQDNENPAHFLFHENWENVDLWKAHMEGQHLKDYLSATEGSVESFVVNQMTKVL